MVEKQGFPQGPKDPQNRRPEGGITPEALASLKKNMDDLEHLLRDGALDMESVEDSLKHIIESAGRELLGDATVTDLEAVDEFIFADKLALGTKIGDLTVDRLAPKFRYHFSDTIERNVPARRMVARQLTRGSRDYKIIAALGNNFETHLAHHHRIMEMGVKGPAHITKDWMNIGYMRSPRDNELKAIRWHVSDSLISIGRREELVNSRGEKEDGPMVFGGDL